MKASPAESTRFPEPGIDVEYTFGSRLSMKWSAVLHTRFAAHGLRLAFSASSWVLCRLIFHLLPERSGSTHLRTNAHGPVPDIRPNGNFFLASSCQQSISKYHFCVTAFCSVFLLFVGIIFVLFWMLSFVLVPICQRPISAFDTLHAVTLMCF